MVKIFTLITSHGSYYQVNDETPNPDGGTYVKEDGHLTGELFEEPAIFTVVLDKAPVPTSDDFRLAVEANWMYYTSVGFTTVTEMAYRPDKDFDRLLMAIADKEDCPIRVCKQAMLLDLKSPWNAIW